MTLIRLAIPCAGVAITGCAGLSVTKVGPGSRNEGIRYSLPVPVIQVAPQGNGATSVDVLYLPDGENTYAVSTSCFMSAYAFSLAVDQNGLLNKVEFKQSATAVPQQMASTAGAIASQVANARNAESIAAQTMIDAAQKDADDAQVAADAAEARVRALQQQNPAPSADVLNAAIADLAQARARLTGKTTILDRARNTQRAVNASATSAGPQSVTGPSVAYGDFGVANWKDAAPITLPGNGETALGPVLYVVDEGEENGKPYVRLKAVKTLHGVDDIDRSQAAFATKNFTPRSLTPVLQPPEQIVPNGTPTVMFSVAAMPAGPKPGVLKPVGPAITDINVQVLYAGPTPTDPPSVPQSTTLKATYDKIRSTITFPLTGLSAGNYELVLYVTYKDPVTSAPTPGVCSGRFSIR